MLIKFPYYQYCFLSKNCYCPYKCLCYDDCVIIDNPYRLEDSDDESDDSTTQYDAVTCTGRQINSNVFVFGPNFQVTDNGDLIPAEDQRFIWIDEILHKLQRPLNPLPPLSDHSFTHLTKIVAGCALFLEIMFLVECTYLVC